MTRLIILSALLLFPACADRDLGGDESSSTTYMEDSTGTTDEVETSTGDETSSSGETSSSTSDETSNSGEGSGSNGEPDSGTGGEETCRPVVDDLGSEVGQVCEVCTPVWDANGQVIGRDCCWAAQDTDTCLSPCDEGCDEGFACHAVAVAAKLDVCWPE